MRSAHTIPTGNTPAHLFLLEHHCISVRRNDQAKKKSKDRRTFDSDAHAHIQTRTF